MKKLLVLALVLGIAGFASAGLKISVNGNQNYADDLTLRPSETAVLDIFTDAAIVPTGDYVLPFYALVVHMGQGQITADPVASKVLQGYDAVFIDNGAAAVAAMPVPEGMEGAYGGLTIWSTDPALVAGQTIFDGIIFHCAGPIDAVIQLWRIDDTWGLGELMDEVVIHQPEPMTMLLLGLGGLFLREK